MVGQRADTFLIKHQLGVIRAQLEFKSPLSPAPGDSETSIGIENGGRGQIWRLLEVGKLSSTKFTLGARRATAGDDGIVCGSVWKPGEGVLPNLDDITQKREVSARF